MSARPIGSYCIVNRAASYLYVNVAKAACTSIKLAIAAHVGVDFEQLQWHPPYRRSLRFARRRTGWFRFAFVRHPGARLVSTWADWCQPPYPDVGNFRKNPSLLRWRNASFADFAAAVLRTDDRRMNHHTLRQTAMIGQGPYRVVDYVYKLEDVKTAWPEVRSRTGLGELPHARQSTHAPWPAYYDDETWAMLVRRYAADFQTFGYDTSKP